MGRPIGGSDHDHPRPKLKSNGKCDTNCLLRVSLTISAQVVTPPSDETLLHNAYLDEGTTDTDTEADEDARPRGYGPRGHGPPLVVTHGRRRRPLQDGGGRCSLGIWPPERRPAIRASRIASLRAALLRQLQDMDITERSLRDVFHAIASGHAASSPFPAWRTRSLLDYAEELWGESARARPGDRDCPVRLRLLECLLRDADDADVAIVSKVAAGVPIGVGIRLPRTPAVYHRRRHWRLAAQEDPQAWRLPWVGPEWRSNYLTAKEERDELERQLEDHVAKGQAIRMTAAELRRRWPDAAVCSLGALTKLNGDGTKKVRMLMDATYGVGINDRIRVRDKDRGPSAPDIKRLLRAQADRQHRTLGLAIDVADAHRMVPVRQQDWRYQVCRATDGGPCYAFTCGVFGVASIAYWWGRLAGAVLRSIHYLAAADLDLWILLVADDFKIESTAARPERSILFVLWFFELLGVPLQWAKTGGGDTVDWVGYSLAYQSHALGLSESRAEWAASWCERHSVAGMALISELREGLGRLSFVAGALEFERPFLAPLFSYLSFYPDSVTRPLPIFVRVLLQFLATRIRRRRYHRCGTVATPLRHGPRVDARAAGKDICIGGWLPTEDASGRIDPGISPWFSLELNETTAPWAYSKKGQPYRTIAALEALGTLIATVLFSPLIKGSSHGLMHFTAFTDNQGNASALGKLMSSSFPLCVVLMELACVLEDLGLNLQLAWTPREHNAEADALSNGNSAGFSKENRLHCELPELPFHCLPKFMELGETFYRQRDEVKTACQVAVRAAKRRRQDRLRTREPW